MASELSAEHRKNFEERLRELGMDPSHVVPELRTGDTPGPTYLSNHPDFESAVPPRPLSVDTVDDLKRLAGVADADYDAGLVPTHRESPPPWSEARNSHAREDLSVEENAQIRQALIAHVYGHSETVASYKAVLNSHFFPMEAAVFAVLDVTVDPGHPLVLKGNNHAYDFGTVTIKPGGQIIIEADATMTCQLMVLE
ncbi:MAG TPA: hypothetical protein VG294_17985 [Solirubrobacteraceae bacterium]|jgi:hypothetical protein|nr:hypothetical protein [Solirubrobacteraceae bacterium]